MSSVITNFEKLDSFINIMKKIIDKTYAESSNEYFQFSDREIDKNESEESLIEILKETLGNKEEAYEFLTQKFDVNELDHYFKSIKNVTNVFLYLIKPLLDNNEGLKVSPLLMCMYFNNSKYDKLESLFKSYLPQDKVDTFYDQLIQDKNGKYLNSINIIDKYFKKPGNKNRYTEGSFIGNCKKLNVFFETYIYQFSGSLSNPFIKKMLVNIVDEVASGNLVFDIDVNNINVSVFLNNMTTDKVKDFVRENVLKNMSMDSLNNYIPLLSINSLNNVLSLLNENTPDINNVVMNKLNKDNELNKMIDQVESYKVGYYKNSEDIRNIIDRTLYLDLFKGLEEAFGKEVLKNYIKDLNKKNNMALENIIGLGKIKTDKQLDFLFYSLLKNENKETVNYLLDNGYVPHILESNEINKGRKYKNLISADNMEKINNIVVEKVDLKNELNLLIGNINKGNLKKLSAIITNQRDEFDKVIGESRKLDKSVHYNYVPVDLKPDFISKLSPIMNVILSGQIDVVNLLLENNIEFTEKEKSLLHLAFNSTKKSQVDLDVYRNNIINYIKKEDNLQNLFVNSVVSGSLHLLVNSDKWNNKTEEIFNVLFDTYYDKLNEKEKLIFLDEGFVKHRNNGLGFLIYEKLSDEDKEILLSFKAVEKESDFVYGEIKSIIDYHSRKREFLKSTLGKVTEFVVKSIKEDDKNGNEYLTNLKNYIKKVDFSNVDILDGSIALIEKEVLMNSLSIPVTLNHKKNRL